MADVIEGEGVISAEAWGATEQTSSERATEAAAIKSSQENTTKTDIAKEAAAEVKSQVPDQATIQKHKQQDISDAETNQDKDVTGGDAEAKLKLDKAKLEGIKKFDIKKFKAAKDGAESVEETSVPKVEDKKEEVKKERDFTGLEHLNEGERALLKNTSIAAFEYTKAQIVNSRKEATELKTKVAALEKSVVDAQKTNGIPPQWYEHPESYRLHPEYVKAETEKNDANIEVNHWRTQFKRVRAGEEWDNVESDGKGGLLVVKRPSSAEAETYLMEKINEAKSKIATSDAKIGEIQHGFKSQIEGRNNLVKSREDQVYPKFAQDPTLYEKDPHVQTIEKVFKEANMTAVPISTFAKLYSYHMELLNQHRAALAKTTTAKSLDAERAKAGPSSGEINKGAAGGQTKETPKLSVAAFNKFKESE